MIQNMLKMPLFSLCLLSPLISCVSVPGTDRKAFILLSKSKEESMGAAAYQETLKSFGAGSSKSKIITSGKHYEMLQRVGRRIAAVSHVRDYNWKFTLVDDEQKNAFCLPGGKVVFYTGILKDLQNEAGMAIVMGHEVAHAVARHGAQRVSNAMALNAGVLVLSAAAFREDPEKFQTSMALLGAGAAVGVTLPFSRSNETEADSIGIMYAAKSGYDPREGPRFWARFGKGASATPQWLSTHPHGKNRVNNLNKLIPEAMKLYNQSPKHGLGESI